ncbi:hypothetical protein I9W82_005583 [Candida metapsilosis]|uniref:Uncharacterized protein n=1 Tax=Candida metapsilosis TaxID=273372 RepID=A0A8H7ZDA4_9ASCO|nr:hypothetical protein I9W82_005583 [Candida metapsilosis]
MSKSNPSSLHVTTVQGQNETMDKFERASIYKYKMPSKDIVETLFDNLLAIRAFPEKAKVSLRSQTTERKWDLLLAEKESNGSFDLNRMSVASMSTDTSSEIDKTSSHKTIDRFSMAKYDGFLPSLKPRKSSHNLKDPKNSRQTMISEGSPGWFVWKLLNKDVDLQNLVRLEKSLTRNKLIDGSTTWVQNFLSIQGETALAVNLSSISKKVIKSDDEYNYEYLLVKCLKSALENQSYLERPSHDNDTSISKTVIMTSLMGALTSTRMSTRFLVTEILVNLMKNGHKELREDVISHLRSLTFNNKKSLNFEAWLEVFGSSLRTASWGSKISDYSYLKNYITITLILLNVIVRAVRPARKRIAMRKDFEESHILSIFETIRQFEDDRIHQELEKYEKLAREDEQEKRIRHSKTLPRIPNPNEESDSRSVSISSVNASSEGDELARYGLFGSQKRRTISNETEFSSPVIQQAPPPRNDDSVLAQQVYSKIVALETSSNTKGLINKVLLLLDRVLENGDNLSPAFNENVSVSTASVERLIDSMSSDSVARSAIAETQSLKRELKRQQQLNENLIKTAESMNNTKSSAQNEAQLMEMKSLGLQISLLQRQIKQLEQQKAKGPNNRNISHSFEELSNRDEAEDVIDTSDEIQPQTEVEKKVVQEPIERNFRRGPPTPPLLYSRPIQKLEKNDIPSIADTNGDTENDSKELVQQTVDIVESVPQQQQQQQQAFVVPPSPPAPTFLEDLRKGVEPASDTSSIGIPSAPPIPEFLQNLKSTEVQTPSGDALPGEEVAPTAEAPPPPPPPPPPLPPFAFASRNVSTSSILTTTSTSSSIPPAAPPPPPPAELLTTSKPAAAFVDHPTSDNDQILIDESALVPIKPKVKLKQLHWNKIEDIEKTFWSEFEDSYIAEKLTAEGVFDEIEKIFVASQPSKKSAESRKNRKINSDFKAAKVSFLSRDLAQQFGINLHMFAGLSEEALILKILRCHSEILENISVIEFFNNDALVEVSDSLAKNLLPYSSDPRTGKKPQKDPSELDRAGRLYLELCFNLKHYWRARSKALLFTQTYSKEFHDLKQKLDLVDHGISCVKESSGFRGVLSIMKTMGNFMNEHTKQARGFKLDSLQRLKYMKDESNSMSFLHYIEKIIRQSFSEYGSFVSDLESLIETQNVSIEQLEVDCRAINKEVEIINNSLEKGKLSREKDLHPSDRIRQTIAQPMLNATSRNALVQSRMKRTLSSFRSLMVYFGEDPNDSKAKDSFFQKIITFVAEFKKAHIDNIQREEEQRVYDARKKKIEDESAGKTPTGEVVEEKIFVDSVEESSAVIDSLLEKLKSTSDHSKTNRENRKSKLVHSPDNEGPAASELDNITVENEYESVNNLKRRLTKRKSKLGLTSANEQSTSRAQVMLHQLRTAEDLLIPDDDVNKENMIDIEK